MRSEGAAGAGAAAVAARGGRPSFRRSAFGGQLQTIRSGGRVVVRELLRARRRGLRIFARRRRPSLLRLELGLEALLGALDARWGYWYIEAMVQILQGNPELMQTIGDLAFRNMDWPGADEIAERLKKLLPPALQDEDEEGQPTVDPQLQAMVQQLQAQLEEAIAAAEGKEAEMELKAAELEIKKFDAETKRIQALGGIQGQQDEFEQKFNTLAEMLADVIAKQGNKPESQAA